MAKETKALVLQWKDHDQGRVTSWNPCTSRVDVTPSCGFLNFDVLFDLGLSIVVYKSNHIHLRIEYLIVLSRACENLPAEEEMVTLFCAIVGVRENVFPSDTDTNNRWTT